MINECNHDAIAAYSFMAADVQDGFRYTISPMRYNSLMEQAGFNSRITERVCITQFVEVFQREYRNHLCEGGSD